LLEGAETLSLVFSFNVSSEDFNDELNVLSRISGSSRENLNRVHAELLRRQLLQKRGDWRAVLPHAVANRLARRALENIAPEKINAELLRIDNLRLFKSCAHRMSFMHDFEPAKHLARTWLKAGGPFYNIAQCDDELLIALKHIAPVLPDVVLTAIENAMQNQRLSSLSNQHIRTFVHLLKKIAYDQKFFDRAAKLIFLFAETEKPGEKTNGITSELAGLFSLRLSGTQASPEQRCFFVSSILKTANLRQLEIAQSIFQKAFQQSHYVSYVDFNFGAHSRDYGWEPKTNKDILDWLAGFIKVLSSALHSDNKFVCEWVKSILASHFMGLWKFKNCLDVFEELIREFGGNGEWPDMWVAIRRTIGCNKEKRTSNLFCKLIELEKLASPTDLNSEIEAYVLTDASFHDFLVNADQKILLKAEKLGELASHKPDCLERLASKIYAKHNHKIASFGKGLAKGASNPSLVFDTLIRLMQKQELEVIYPRLFCGFIAGIHADNAGLAQKLQTLALDVPELKKYSIELLLSATPITPWGIKKLIELAKFGEIEAQRFESIAYGSIHEAISDDDLSRLIVALNDLADGVFSSIEILGMRFFTEAGKNACHSVGLRSTGRKTILKFLSMHRSEITKRQLHGVNRVIGECLSGQVMKEEVLEIIDMICEGLESYRLYSFDLNDIIAGLVKEYPEYVLERMLTGNHNSENLMGLLFKSNQTNACSPLNLASVDRLIAWCDGCQDHLTKLASAISIYTSQDKDFYLAGSLKNVTLSHHIKSILDIVDDKSSMVELIYTNTCLYPNGGWFGSIADIFEARSRAFEELLTHASFDVRKIAQAKLPLLNKFIEEQREREAEEQNRWEQRFE